MLYFFLIFYIIVSVLIGALVLLNLSQKTKEDIDSKLLAFSYFIYGYELFCVIASTVLSEALIVYLVNRYNQERAFPNILYQLINGGITAIIALKIMMKGLETIIRKMDLKLLPNYDPNLFKTYYYIAMCTECITLFLIFSTINTDDLVLQQSLISRSFFWLLSVVNEFVKVDFSFKKTTKRNIKEQLLLVISKFKIISNKHSILVIFAIISSNIFFYLEATKTELMEVIFSLMLIFIIGCILGILISFCLYKTNKINLKINKTINKKR